MHEIRLEICTDCLMWIANGETPPDMSEEETDAYIARTWEASRGWHVSPGGPHREDCPTEPDENGVAQLSDQDCSCDDLGFSWRSCDLCGSGLGGDRFAAHLWGDAG